MHSSQIQRKTQSPLSPRDSTMLNLFELDSGPSLDMRQTNPHVLKRLTPNSGNTSESQRKNVSTQPKRPLHGQQLLMLASQSSKKEPRFVDSGPGRTQDYCNGRKQHSLFPLLSVKQKCSRADRKRLKRGFHMRKKHAQPLYAPSSSLKKDHFHEAIPGDWPTVYGFCLSFESFF